MVLATNTASLSSYHRVNAKVVIAASTAEVNSLYFVSSLEEKEIHPFGKIIITQIVKNINNYLKY
jgi:hypothetical protein